MSSLAYITRETLLLNGVGRPMLHVLWVTLDLRPSLLHHIPNPFNRLGNAGRDRILPGTVVFGPDLQALQKDREKKRLLHSRDPLRIWQRRFSKLGALSLGLYAPPNTPG